MSNILANAFKGEIGSAFGFDVPVIIALRIADVIIDS
jgi:hypothetical protein